MREKGQNERRGEGKRATVVSPQTRSNSPGAERAAGGIHAGRERGGKTEVSQGRKRTGDQRIFQSEWETPAAVASPTSTALGISSTLNPGRYCTLSAAIAAPVSEATAAPVVWLEIPFHSLAWIYCRRMLPVLLTRRYWYYEAYDYSRFVLKGLAMAVHGPPSVQPSYAPLLYYMMHSPINPCSDIAHDSDGVSTNTERQSLQVLRTWVCKLYVSPSVPSPSRKTSELLSVNSS